tara:strand:+ start:380 stop:1204 length:825 start_codon:yes stop_codon:yes gene_type:complete
LKPPKAYKDFDFLGSSSARHIRILCEYEQPFQRFKREGVANTIAFFGSARPPSKEEWEKELEELKSEVTASAGDASAKKELAEMLINHLKMEKLSNWYEKTRELARRLTEWDMAQHAGEQKFIISTGAGPGMMEAANRGAHEAGGRSIGLGISLPHEPDSNPYVTPELNFEFHYFFTRKFWFLKPAKAIVACPGGFGTFDETFEYLTLRQTNKIQRDIPTVLFGTEFWKSIIDMEKLVEWRVISEDDLDLFYYTDSVDEAFNFLTDRLLPHPRP